MSDRSPFLKVVGWVKPSDTQQIQVLGGSRNPVSLRNRVSSRRLGKAKRHPTNSGQMLGSIAFHPTYKLGDRSPFLKVGFSLGG